MIRSCVKELYRITHAHIPCVSSKIVPLVSKTRPKGTENCEIEFSVDLRWSSSFDLDATAISCVVERGGKESRESNQMRRRKRREEERKEEWQLRKI